MPGTAGLLLARVALLGVLRLPLTRLVARRPPGGPGVTPLSRPATTASPG